MTNREKLLSVLPGDADGMIVTSNENQIYLSDFDFTDGYVLITKNKSYLITDSRYIEAAKAECAKDIVPVLFGGLGDGTVQKLLDENGVGTLLFEPRISYADLERLKNAFKSVSFVPGKDIIEDLRDLKEEYEKEYIVKAQRIAERSLEQLLGVIKTDMTEIEVAAELEFLMKKNGSRNPSFYTIAVSGKASSMPHGVPRNVKLEKGFLTIDFGAMYKGYHSDMTRTFCIGKADGEMKKIYSTVLEAQEKAIEAIMNGERNCRKIDGVARGIIAGAGYGRYFGHGLGHGVGLEIHESPRLSPKAKEDALLVPGHVVTVEPGIYLEGKYGVRIEDMMYIGKNGAENLTLSPKKLVEI